jgi:hypothetical protein
MTGPAAEVTPPARADGPHFPPEATAEPHPTNARPEAGAVYGAMDMPWAKLVGQIAQAYGR